MVLSMTLTTHFHFLILPRNKSHHVIAGAIFPRNDSPALVTDRSPRKDELASECALFDWREMEASVRN